MISLNKIRGGEGGVRERVHCLCDIIVININSIFFLLKL